MKSDDPMTKRLRRGWAWLGIALLLLAAVPISAHGGFKHVMGTVVRQGDNVLTVKTLQGNIEIALNDKTELTKHGRKAARSDFKPGARVVAEIPEGSKGNLAHSVKIGVVSKTAAPLAKDSRN